MRPERARERRGLRASAGLVVFQAHRIGQMLPPKGGTTWPIFWYTVAAPFPKAGAWCRGVIGRWTDDALDSLHL